jgi:hypothetical protein
LAFRGLLKLFDQIENSISRESCKENIRFGAIESLYEIKKTGKKSENLVCYTETMVTFCLACCTNPELQNWLLDGKFLSQPCNGL